MNGAWRLWRVFWMLVWWRWAQRKWCVIAKLARGFAGGCTAGAAPACLCLLVARCRGWALLGCVSLACAPLDPSLPRCPLPCLCPQAMGLMGVGMGGMLGGHPMLGGLMGGDMAGMGLQMPMGMPGERDAAGAAGCSRARRGGAAARPAAAAQLLQQAGEGGRQLQHLRRPLRSLLGSRARSGLAWGAGSSGPTCLLAAAGALPQAWPGLTARRAGCRAAGTPCSWACPMARWTACTRWTAAPATRCWGRAAWTAVRRAGGRARTRAFCGACAGRRQPSAPRQPPPVAGFSGAVCGVRSQRPPAALLAASADRACPAPSILPCSERPGPAGRPARPQQRAGRQPARCVRAGEVGGSGGGGAVYELRHQAEQLVWSTASHDPPLLLLLPKPPLAASRPKLLPRPPQA